MDGGEQGVVDDTVFPEIVRQCGTEFVRQLEEHSTELPAHLTGPLRLSREAGTQESDSCPDQRQTPNSMQFSFPSLEFVLDNDLHYLGSSR